MRVESYQLFHVRIPFKTAFAHASHERRHSDALIVALNGGGLTGWGEIQPRAYVTGETIESVKAGGARGVFKRFVSKEISSFEDARDAVFGEVDDFDRTLAAFGGFEMALLDLVGRHTNASVGAALGEVVVDSLPAGVIIGFDIATEDLAKHCALLRFKRRKHIKVKVGLDDDVARIRIIGEKMKVPLRIDANEAWTVDESIERLSVLSAVADLASVEQPVAADDIDGLRAIRAAGHRVMADESLCSFADAERLVERGAADVFNIRLGKHGGFLNAQRIARFGAAHGIELHLGTMVGETGVLTRATEIFATRVFGFECLDGKGQNHHLSDGDVLVESPQPFDVSPDAPGIGVEVDREALDRYQRQSVVY